MFVARHLLLHLLHYRSLHCDRLFYSFVQIAQILLGDKEDLIHKAMGWMLREVGKRCGAEVLERFLTTNYRAMPRTTVRYAIERFPEGRRQMYLRGRV